MRKAKVLIKFNLVRDMKGTENSFHRYVSDERNIRETMSPVWKEALCLVTQDAEKAELLRTFFIGFHQQVLQPHWLSLKRQRQGLGK